MKHVSNKYVPIECARIGACARIGVIFFRKCPRARMFIVRDYVSGRTADECREKGIHCWSVPMPISFGGPTVYHAQHCILCNAQGQRVNHTSGKKSRKGATIEVGYSEGCVRAHAARRARCIFRKVVKLISIVRFWSHVTYLPPTGGGAGYWRVEEEFSRLQLDG